MSGRMIALLIAALSGVAMAVQGTLNGALGKAIGLWETTMIVHVVGAAIVGVLIFGFKLGAFELDKCAAAPWYTYLGGVLSIDRKSVV